MCTEKICARTYIHRESSKSRGGEKIKQRKMMKLNGVGHRHMSTPWLHKWVSAHWFWYWQNARACLHTYSFIEANWSAWRWSILRSYREDFILWRFFFVIVTVAAAEIVFLQIVIHHHHHHNVFLRISPFRWLLRSTKSTTTGLRVYDVSFTI